MKTGSQENQAIRRASSLQVANLINTSVDDLKSSLGHVTNAAVLNEARQLAFERGLKSKAQLIERRIRQLKGLARMAQGGAR